VELHFIVLVLLVIHQRRWRFDDRFRDRRLVFIRYFIIKVALQIRDLPPDSHIIRETQQRQEGHDDCCYYYQS
jgi:hypothetical protein